MRFSVHLEDHMRCTMSVSMHLEDHMRCTYSSKPCDSLRTTKKGGGLHQFCEFHRIRANRNQRRVDRKRRELRMLRRQALKPRATTQKAASTLGLPDPVDFTHSQTSLSDEDVAWLQEMLFGTPVCASPPALHPYVHLMAMSV